MNRPVRAAIFASGGGSNFQALVEHARGRGPDAPWRSELLVVDREGAGALDRARDLGVPARVVDPHDAEGLHSVLSSFRIDMLLLAGYLRLIPAGVVRAYAGRILNIHPSLLPKFGGRGMYGSRVHEAVLAAGDTETGVTVHLVDEEYDRGRILARHSVPVHAGDTPRELARRVLAVEHRLYPRVADHLAEAILRGDSPEPFSAVESP